MTKNRAAVRRGSAYLSELMAKIGIIGWFAETNNLAAWADVDFLNP